MVVSAHLATVNDIVPGDDSRLELLQGELIKMSPVNIRHLRIVGTLVRDVGVFVQEHDLGIVGPEGGFVLERDPDTLLAPDVAFIRKDRVPSDDDSDGFPELAPDLVIEVVSPGDRASEVYAKTRVYLDAGVRMVITVWPKNQTVTVERSVSSRTTLTLSDVFDGDDVLPGFSLPIKEIFE